MRIQATVTFDWKFFQHISTLQIFLALRNVEPCAWPAGFLMILLQSCSFLPVSHLDSYHPYPRKLTVSSTFLQNYFTPRLLSNPTFISPLTTLGPPSEIYSIPFSQHTDSEICCLEYFSWGQLWPPLPTRGHLAMTGDIFSCHNREGVL